jgi:hypothetical protein
VPGGASVQVPPKARREKVTLTTAVPPPIATARRHTASRHELSGAPGSSGYAALSSTCDDALLLPCADGTRATHLLLYLNDQTFVGDAGEALALDVRAALFAKMPILMLHERDLAAGACAFARFFEVPRPLIS